MWLAIDESGARLRPSSRPGDQKLSKKSLMIFLFNREYFSRINFFCFNLYFWISNFLTTWKTLIQTSVCLFWQLSQAVNSFDSCYKLLQAVGSFDSYKKGHQLWQLFQAVASLQAFRLFHSSHIQSPALIAESCHQLSLLQQAIDSFDSLYKLSTLGWFLQADGSFRS